MFAMALLAVLSPGTVQPAQAASYEETVRCAGLTQAASELEGGEGGEGRRGAGRAATLPDPHAGSGVRIRPNPGRGVAFAS